MSNNQTSLNALLSMYGDYQKVEADEEIFSYGATAERVYLVLKGLVRLFVQDQDKKEQEVAHLQSGAILGESALLQGQERTARAVTYQETTLMSFTPANFRELLEQQTVLTEKIMTNLCQRINNLQQPQVDLPDLTASTTPEESTTRDESDSEEEQVDSDPLPQNAEDFFLEGHDTYQVSAEDRFDYYLYTKEITCPVCSTNLEVHKVRNSRLRLEEIRDDLRPIFKEFKAEWYKIWCCHNCFYTANKDDFFDIAAGIEDQVKNEFRPRIKEIFGDDFKPGYSKPRNLNEVFTTYYLAIKLYNLIGVSKNKLGFAWLRLKWLYEDVGEDELANKASQQAMENLREFYFKDDNVRLSRKQRDKIKLLLAVLFYRHGQADNALPLLDDLIRSSQTNRRYEQIARAKFTSIREEQQAEKEESNS
ncbi:MAG: DUF2225 domain-containing protein [Bacillota bacterium]